MKYKTTPAIPQGFKWWIVSCLILLLGSLSIFVANIVASFMYFSAGTTPLWVTVLGVIGVLGIVAAFSGLFFVMILVAVKTRREEKQRAAG